MEISYGVSGSDITLVSTTVMTHKVVYVTMIVILCLVLVVNYLLKKDIGVVRLMAMLQYQLIQIITAILLAVKLLMDAISFHQ